MEDIKPNWSDSDTEAESYYDILKVSPNATITEIVAAYHTARNAFSKDSVATYSLFSQDETKEILDKLELAYHTLSNVEKKHQYDHYLDLKARNIDVPSIAEFQKSQKQEIKPEPKPTQEARIENTPIPNPYTGVRGSLIRFLRESRDYTIDEVARVTKIPKRYIHAIEEEEKSKHPARVYLQGFVKNLATFYRLEPTAFSRIYLSELDCPAPESDT